MHGDNNMESWEPKQFIDYIDEKYQIYKKKKVSRVSLDWGLWSRDMNVVLRKRCEAPSVTAKDSELTRTRLKYVFAYWINRSQLIELHYRSKYLGGRAKKMLTKQGKDIRYFATDDPMPKRLASFLQLAKNDAVTYDQSRPIKRDLGADNG